MNTFSARSKITLNLEVTNDLAQLLRRLVRNIVMGLWVMALLISSSIICTTDMKPKIFGIPALGAFGYVTGVRYRDVCVYKAYVVEKVTEYSENGTQWGSGPLRAFSEFS